MASPFSRTLRSLDADHLRGTGLGLATAAVLLTLWSLWFFAGRVTVVARSDHARLVGVETSFRLESQSEGTVTAVLARVGQTVSEGDLLLTLDTERTGLALDEARAQEASLSAQLEALEASVAAAATAIQENTAAGHAERSAERAEVAAAAVLAARAETEASQLASLAASGSVSEATLLEANARRDEAAARLRAASARLDQADRGLAGAEKDREVAFAALQASRDRVRGELEALWSRTAELELIYDRSFVRAPVDGELADLAPLAVGALVQPGEALGLVVPSGALKMVADLSPADALGRVQPGQPARVRLDGFPWTWFGTLQATVDSVAGEPRDGLVRVELALDEDADSRLPLRHGLTGTVEIALEQASPASLALRAAGRLLERPAGSAP